MVENAAQNHRSGTGQFSLGWALAISVVVHILLALLGGWLPEGRPLEAAEPDETVLRFSFADPVEIDDPSDPEGDVPFQTAQPPPQPPLQPQTPLFAEQPQPAETSEIEQMPSERSIEPIEQAVQEPVDQPPDSEHSETNEPLDPVTPAFPEDDQQPLFPREEDALAVPDTTTRVEPDRAFDLDRAIQDFGRVLDDVRAASPPTNPGNATPRNVFVPDPSELSTTGYGLGNLTFETADFDWSDYARAVYTQIWRAWHNRLLRLTNEFEKWAHVNRNTTLRHANQIRFVIERSGQVSEIMIEGPSGCVPLDDSATQALAEVILPPLPEAFPKEREVVHARFIAIGDIRSMKPVLTRMKALNYF